MGGHWHFQETWVWVMHGDWSWRPPEPHRPSLHHCSPLSTITTRQEHMLETPPTLVAGHEEINLELTRKLPHFVLSFPVLAGIMQTTGRGKISMVLPSTGPCMAQYWFSRQNMWHSHWDNSSNVMGQPNSDVNAMDAIIYFPDLKPAPQKAICDWYYKSGQIMVGYYHCCLLNCQTVF